MSDSTFSQAGQTDADRAELLSMIFAQMIMQQSQMAMMLLGKVPHPQSGETVRDIEGARMFIDQLEMIEAKTKGNLSREEDMLLKQTLMSLRLAFVEAVESPAKEEGKTIATPAAGAATAPAPAPEASSALPPVPDEDGKKKFSKKY